MKKQELCTLWDVWSKELPVNFPKTEVIEVLVDRWGISKPNVYARIKSGHLKNFVCDISFLYTMYAIGFTTDRGFFFDSEKHRLMLEKSEMEAAKMYGLSKTLA